MRKINEKLTYANVVATLALFIAVGGTSAYAANQLSANSVGTKQLKNGAVTKVKLADGVNDERGPEGKQGTVGPQGKPGAPGTPGAAGKSGATHAVIRRDFGGEWEAVAKCEPGEVATGGGGYMATEAHGGGFIASSEPVPNASGVPIGWEVTGGSAEEEPGFPVAYVVCVSP
jgi:hypothetical protein